MAVRRMTARMKSQVNRLADILYDFLPMTARSSNTVTFERIFKESNVQDYLGNSKLSKKQRLIRGFENLLRYHERLPIYFIRKIVPAAIEYRRHKRNPLKQSEIDELIECLNSLGIDMEKELREIEIDETVPEIQVPTEELIERLDNHPLVEEIRSEPFVQFQNGHFNESVRKAAERFEAKIQDLSGETNQGASLMGKVFSPDSPILQLNDLNTTNERNIQDGYKFLSMG
ncbi:MAG: TIGR02391 family protein [Candidatus Marinimicrobia bacterium]|nr:TIGR02391 family protein [Candidatus Neomarinimicrobiota bacterium]MCF7829347.1 TIGR02391 family protein [Candidatus Neomarinimicrobiota bacterium]MCF7879990.1 TIGR02391 family protein [Candidatus Neomarinimicrobiota bacterium]